MSPCAAPVLVAGGGPTALAAALTLLQNNVPVRLIAQESQYRIGQRAAAIWPRTLEAFHILCVPDFDLLAKPLIPVREYKPGTLEPIRTFTLYAHNDPTPSVPYSNVRFLGQPTLEGILRSHIEKYGCSVELGTELQSFQADGERVVAKLIKRKDGVEVVETFEASYLIGADGAKGVTRKQLGLTFLGETMRDINSVVGDICLEHPGIDREHWHFFGNRASDFFMLRPTDEIAPDGFFFFMTMKNYTSKQLISDEKLMVKCMSEVIGCEIDIRKIVTLSEYRPNVRMVDKFGSGRVFVAGDAAHVHTPAGGQGLNSSVQDALNLAWKLSLVYKGLSPATLLDSYTAERLPVIAEMLNITTGIFSNLRSEPIQSFDKKLNMLGVNYRSSPIVVDEFTCAEPTNAYGVLNEGVLVAGDRAPDAPELTLVGARREAAGDAETRTTLFDVFSVSCHTVLVFVPDVGSSTDVCEALRGYPEDVVRPVIVLPQGTDVTTTDANDIVIVVDRGGHAYRAYLVKGEKKKVAVVRPDGVVGAIVRGVEGIGAYFFKVLV